VRFRYIVLGDHLMIILNSSPFVLLVDSERIKRSPSESVVLELFFLILELRWRIAISTRPVPSSYMRL
jgi:hypothetical protein